MSREGGAKLLRLAADKFESGEIEWAQATVPFNDNDYPGMVGLFHVPAGCYCVATALIAFNSYASPDAMDACRVLADHLAPHGVTIDPTNAVFEWNDAKGRTVGEIVAAMRAAADKVAA